MYIGTYRQACLTAEGGVISELYMYLPTLPITSGGHPLKVSIPGQVQDKVSEGNARVSTCAEVDHVTGTLHTDVRETRKQLKDICKVVCM